MTLITAYLVLETSNRILTILYPNGMRLILSIAFSCLCLQQALAQTGSAPDWYVNPKSGEYVGCSFPSEDVHSRPETALLSALLNYVACNIDLGGPVNVTGEYTGSESTGLVSTGLETSVAERNHIVMLNYQMCRLETFGNDTYVSVKVDEKGDPKDGIKIQYSQEITSTGLGDNSCNMMCTEKIELELTTHKKYTINTHWYVSDSENEQIILLFYGDGIHSAQIKGKTIETANYEMSEEQSHNKMAVRRLPFYRYCGDISKNGVGGAFWQSILQRLSEKVSGMDDVLDKEEHDIDWKHFKNTNEISGKILYVMFKPKMKTSK